MNKTIGLVVPITSDETPPEASIMYPHVKFISRGVGVSSLTPSGYDDGWKRVMPVVTELNRSGVDAIMVAGTSLTFYRGYDAHLELLASLRRLSAVPISTMSEAVVCGLKTVGAKRIAVATAYTDEINGRLTGLLTGYGMEVLSIESFGFTSLEDPVRQSERDIVRLARRAVERADRPEGILISCGGLATLHCAATLEREFSIPVVTSSQSGIWMGCGLAGENSRIYGFGSMLQSSPSAIPRP